MSDDPFTPAELEVACDAVKAAGPYAVPVDYARAVLRAVAPLIVARVRAETADGITADIHALELPRPLPTHDFWAGQRAAQNAAEAIARAHRTTPGDDHA